MIPNDEKNLAESLSCDFGCGLVNCRETFSMRSLRTNGDDITVFAKLWSHSDLACLGNVIPGQSGPETSPQLELRHHLTTSPIKFAFRHCLAHTWIHAVPYARSEKNIFWRKCKRATLFVLNSRLALASHDSSPHNFYAVVMKVGLPTIDSLKISTTASPRCFDCES